MSLFRIALRSILQRGVASLLTMLSMALGVMLVVAVLAIHGVISQSFKNNASLGYNVIVGAKGGQEQLVLNTVFYLSKPVENIPYNYYLEFLKKQERDNLLAQSYASQGTAALADALQLSSGSGLEHVALLQVTKNLPAAFQSDMAAKGHPPVEFGRDGKYGLMTELAIPLCLGDYYGRFRVVGTTPTLFNDLVYDVDANRKFEFAQGRNFEWRSKEHGFFEAVVGSHVAREIRLQEIHLNLGTGIDAGYELVRDKINWTRLEKRGELLLVTLGQGVGDYELLKQLGPGVGVIKRTTRPLKIGDQISPRHGDPEGHTHARKFAVVGILKPSGTPNDRAVFVNMEGFYLMEDHAKPVEQQKPGDDATDKPKLTDEQMRAKMAAMRQKQLEVERAADPDPLPAEQREVTALLLKVNSLVAPGLGNAVNEGAYAQAVFPVGVIHGLFAFIVDPIQWTLLILTAMICIVSGISILVSIYNSMSERRGEIAIMRALGAGRGTVMAIILLEATLLATGGGLLGWLTGHTGAWAMSPLIEERTGVLIGFLNRLTLPAEAALIPSLLLLAILVGLWPALSAYRTDVAKSLGK